MLGSEILVAPIVSGGNSRTVVLPKGNWIDEEGKKYKGGKSYTIEAGLTYQSK